MNKQQLITQIYQDYMYRISLLGDSIKTMHQNDPSRNPVAMYLAEMEIAMLNAGITPDEIEESLEELYENEHRENNL